MSARISAQEFARLCPKADSPLRKPSKYKNKPTFDAEGRRFASRAEARRDADLTMQQRAGLISQLKRQVRFDLVVNGHKICVYVADWTYVENGRQVVEDKKGHATRLFKVKWALCQALHPGLVWRLT